MRTIKGLLMLATGLFLAACGGGDSVCYGGPGSTECSSGSSNVAVASVEVQSSAEQIDSATGGVTISATVKDAGNVGIADVAVTFSTDSGTLTGAATVTDASGTATAILSAGSDKSPRTITVSVASGGVTGKLSLPVTSSAATSIEVIASGVQVDTGGDPVTISAIVKDSNNVSIPGAPVAFSADSGTLSSASTVTDATGLATAKLSAGANRGNRSILVSVISDTTTSTITLPVVGTRLSYSGPSTLLLAQSSALSVKATDGKGAAIASLPVTVKSSLGNGLSATTLTTDSQGVATVEYTANKAGADTVSFVGAGVTTTASLQVSAENFVFVDKNGAPITATVQVTVDTATKFTVRYLSGGAPQIGKMVNFAATAGTVSPVSAITDGNGDASTWVSSSTASPATVQATLAGSVGAQATLKFDFVATVPSILELQVLPSAIAPNPVGSTVQQAQLVAKVRDKNGNPVKGATVNFNRTADPSGGDLNQASAITDGSGIASVQYIAGALSTGNNGVTIRATIAGTPTVFGDTALTVSQSALFIALGTGNVIENIDPQTYKKDWMLLVTDANGVAVPNIELTVMALPVGYGVGSLVFDSGGWVYGGSVKFCANEDLNYDGWLDPGEDVNGSGILEPGNVISVSTATSTSPGSTGTIRTDSTGRATISLIYAESYAPWVVINLRAETLVAGTEYFNEAKFTVSGAAEDFNNADVPPAGRMSPFGQTATKACMPFGN